MILIWGTFHIFKKQTVTERCSCPHCGSQGMRMSSYTGSEFFHLSFIPLIPLGKVRAVLFCPACHKFYKFVPDGPQLAAVVSERRQVAFARAGADIFVTLDDVTTMAHLGDFDGVQMLLENLARAGATSPTPLLAKGRFLELQGCIQQAMEQYRLAAATFPALAAPSFLLGRFLLDQKRDAEAIAALQNAYKLSDQYEYLPMLLGLVEYRRLQARWDGLAAITTEILRRQPEWASKPAFAKLHAKACKKCKRKVEPTNPYAQV